MSSNGIFSFLIDLVSFRQSMFFSDRIFSRIINYVNKMVNMYLCKQQAELFQTLHEYSNLVAAQHYSYCMVVTWTVSE